MIIQINKTVYQSLSESERCVIDFINQNEAKIPLLSITSIADKTFTSPATVTRAIQKCGFQGITELRYKLSQDTKDEQTLRSPYVKCTLCQGHYDFSFSDFYFIFICCVEASK